MEENTDSLQDKNISEIREGLKKDITNKAKTDTNIQAKRVPTFTMSTCAKADTLMPVNLAPETLTAFLKLKSENVEFDEFVMEKLGYPNKLTMCMAFNAEQIDAIALAIYQIEKGKSLIVGDMAGIGKGRIASAILRYAYINKKIPVFITERTNLFSDIYRDIDAIGGFGTRAGSGNIIYPKPLILNGYKPKGENAVLSPKSKEILYDAQKNSEIIQVLDGAVESGRFPFRDYQVLLGTYSQFSTTTDNEGKDKLKVKYIKELSEKCIFVLDESHNAVGASSGVGNFFRNIALTAGGCLFLSATSAKRAEHLQLYGIRTDLMDSSARDTKALLDIIKNGGEPMQEYLSSSLAQVGQMIRRERSFENCPIEYKVIEQDDRLKEIYSLYDRTIKQYYEILNFVKGLSSSSATDKLVERLIERIVKENPKADFEITNEVRPEDDSELEQWYKRNSGKYEYFIDFKAVKSTRFMVIDTLVMAIKAEYVANEAVRQLTEEREYNYLDKTKKLTTIKPIIAVRNTLDSLWDKIGVTVDMEVQNPDFKLILEASLKSALKANVQFKKVILETDEEKRERKKKKQTRKKTDNLKDEFSESESLLYSDFDDNGDALKNLEVKIKNFQANIFVSPIDKILDIIEKTPRPANDKHGEGSRFLRIAEVSGRKRRLKNEGTKENPKWVLRSTTKSSGDEKEREDEEKNAFKKFDGFNNGKFDALIINEVGSTGASAQASREYKDSRPRSMIIHQVELDVNTEVQKRGRINRTGQICLPTYTYLTSPIPSEIRRLMMLKRKLRGLDSLTTGSQKQSDELVTFRNKKGEEIKDFYNYIGLEVLNNWLLEVGETNNKCNDFFNVNADHIAKLHRKDNDEKFVDDFCRVMELADCQMQEDFYDAINTVYIEKEKELIEADNYFLEVTIEDLEASIKAKKETKFGLNTSPFNSSVFDEENYIFVKNLPYTKKEAQAVSNELCKGMTPEEYQKFLLEDYVKEFDIYINNTINEEYPLPDRKDYSSKEDYEKAVELVEIKKAERIVREQEHSEKVYNILKRYRPNGDFIVPDMEDFIAWMENYQSKNDGAKPNSNKEPSLIKNCGAYLGKFLGYNIVSKSKFKYSGGSIEMIFAFISEIKKIVLKPTTPIMFDLLEWIPIRTSFMLGEESVRIDEWKVDNEKRTVGRFLTGNIVDALRIAEARKKQGIITSYKYTKFTTSENDIRNGVSLRFGDNYIPLKVDDIQTSIPCVTKPFQDALEKMDCVSESRGSKKVCDYALSMNSGYSERFLAEEITDSDDNDVIVIKLIIIGERLKRDAKTGATKSMEKGEKYKSKFFKDKNLQRFIKSTPVESVKNLPDYTLAKKDLQYFRVEEYYLNDNTDKEGLFNYMYEIGKLSFQFRAGTISPEDIKFKTDSLSERKGGEEEQKRDEGMFEYFNIEMYEPLDKNIPYYVSHRNGEFQYIITTSKMLTPIETITFSLNPYNLTEKQMGSNFFSKFTPRETQDFIEEVNKLYKGDNNYFNVGLYVAKIAKQKYASSNYIFGKLARSINVMGEIIYQYVNSEEIKLKTTEKEAKEVREQEYKVEIKPMNSTNIEDYLILLNA
jgi:hypothetical protein